MLDGMTCVYRSNVDLYFYVMGASNENEVYKENSQNVDHVDCKTFYALHQ